MKVRRVLIGAGERQKLGLAVELTQKREITGVPGPP